MIIYKIINLKKQNMSKLKKEEWARLTQEEKDNRIAKRWPKPNLKNNIVLIQEG